MEKIYFIAAAIFLFISLFRPEYGVFFLLFNFLLQPHISLGFEQSTTQTINIIFGSMLFILLLINKKKLPETGISLLLIIFLLIGIISSFLNFGFEFLTDSIKYSYLKYKLNRVGFIFIFTRYIFSRKIVIQFLKTSVLLTTTSAILPIYDFLNPNAAIFISESGRFSGVFGDTNALAAIFVGTFPIAYYFFLHGKQKYIKRIYIISLVLLVLGVFATVSRGGLVGFIFVGMCIVRKNIKKLSTLIILGIAIFLFTTLAQELFMQRQTITTTLSGKTEIDSSAKARIKHIKVGFQLWIRNPIWGVGPRGTWDAAKEQLNIPPLWIHNTYMYVLADYGTTGFIVYMWMYVLAFRCLRRLSKHSDEFYRELTPYLRTALIGYMLCAMFIGISIEIMLLVFLALPIMLYKISQIEEQNDRTAVIASGEST